MLGLAGSTPELVRYVNITGFNNDRFEKLHNLFFFFEPGDYPVLSCQKCPATQVYPGDLPFEKAGMLVGKFELPP